MHSNSWCLPSSLLPSWPIQMSQDLLLWRPMHPTQWSGQSSPKNMGLSKHCTNVLPLPRGFLPNEVVIINTEPHNTWERIMFVNELIYISPGPARVVVLQLCHDSPLMGHCAHKDPMASVFLFLGARDAPRNTGFHCLLWGMCLCQSTAPQTLWSSPTTGNYVLILGSSHIGFTTILTIVGHFTKMAHFIPCNGLTSAEETAQLWINHMVSISFQITLPLIEGHNWFPGSGMRPYAY